MVTPEPKPEKLLFTHETMLPQRSAADSTMVSIAAGVARTGGGRFGRIDLAAQFLRMRGRHQRLHFIAQAGIET